MRIRLLSSIRIFSLMVASLPMYPLSAKEYVVPVDDVAGFFAKLPDDATEVRFSAASVYRCSFDIVLPDRQLLVIDGAGAKLILGPNSNGFTRRIVDQKDAMKRLSSRYVIRDFAAIEGGLKGIDLQATLGSSIINCRLMGQVQTAIDLRFCLMTRLELVLVTNPKNKGIVLRQGDWPGATTSNSQSNSSTLEQCRVYCAATTTQAFTILNSGGVRMIDCISEGAAADHDLFLSATINGREDHAGNNPVVKSFMLSNFHVEHRVRKASIYVNMPAKAVVELENVYWNAAEMVPAILYVSGQLNITNIGWFKQEFRIHTRVSSPRINIDRCHSALRVGEQVENGTKAGVLELVDPLPRQTGLKLDYVRVTRPSL